MSADTVQIPNRSLFRQNEVCDIAQVQPYVLRSWEAEFPDLGVAKTQGGARMYRRADLDRVLQIKQLLFVEGLTLAGARRRLQEQPGPPAADGVSLEDLLKSDVRERIVQVRQTLRELAMMLARQPGTEGGEFQLAAPAPKRSSAPKKSAPPAKSARKVAKRK
jgi:DNA-binding transcriptional MerR regulator